MHLSERVHECSMKYGFDFPRYLCIVSLNAPTAGPDLLALLLRLQPIFASQSNASAGSKEELQSNSGTNLYQKHW